MHKFPDGSECPRIATHFWGNERGRVEYCCVHFDMLLRDILGMDMQKEVVKSHPEMVEEYNRRTKHTTVIPGAPCDSEKKKDG